jgi:hypothetical protein
MCEEVLPLVTYPHWPSLGPKHLVAIGSLKPASNRSAEHYCKLLCSAEPRCQSYVIAPARSRQSNHTLVPSCKLHVCSGALSQSPLRPPAARLVHTTPHSMHLVPPWEVHVYAAAQAIDHSLACRVQSVDDVGVYSTNVFVMICPTAAAPTDHVVTNQLYRAPLHALHADSPRSPSSLHGSIALCVAPLYNEVGVFAVWDLLDYHAARGVSHAFIYLTRCGEGSPARTLAVGVHPRVTLLCMEWVNALRMHQRGQNWANNDCVHRAAHEKFAWALTLDLDEHLIFARPTIAPGGSWSVAARPGPHEDLFDLLHSAPMAEVHTFGSMRWKLPQNAYKVTCTNSWMPREQCVRNSGWRKHLVNTRAIFAVNIHWADKCKDAPPGFASRRPLVVRPRLCTIHDVNVSEGVFIAHDRMGVLGAGFDGMPGSGKGD